MKIALLPVLAASLLLSACLTQPPAPAVDRTPVESRATSPAQAPAPVSAPAPAASGRTYMVKRGDTLFRIAREQGVSPRDLASWNALDNPSAIRDGQVLRLTPPGTDGPVVAQAIARAPVVESRSLEAPAAASGDIKREPRVGKEPYSDEAYARLNRQGSAAPAPAPVPPAAVVPPAAEPVRAEAPRNDVPPVSPDDVPWQWPVNGKVVQGFGQGSKGIDFAGKAGDPVQAAADGKVVYAGAGLPGYGELVIVKHNATYLSAYAHNRKILVKEGQSVTRGQKIAEMGSTGTDSVKLHFEIRRQGNPVDPLPLLPKR